MRFLSFTEGLILSICLHLLLVGLGILYNLNFARPFEPKNVAIDFIELPKGEKSVNSVKKSHPTQLNQQIVEQNETAKKDNSPNDSRFLSAQNQKVDKQTVARERGEFKNVTNPTAAKALRVQGRSDPNKQAGNEKTKPTLQDLSPHFDPLAIKERQQKKDAKEALGADFDTSEGGDVSQSNDYIKNIDQGSQTMLNTREFKYYTYYSRIRRQLSQHWEPKVRDKLTKLFRQGRSIASDHDHITKLLIVLNQQGTLVRVQVLSESGVRDLDDAAMEAFRSAAPFPNPPKGIIETDGTVKIRWDFVLES